MLLRAGPLFPFLCAVTRFLISPDTGFLLKEFGAWWADEDGAPRPRSSQASGGAVILRDCLFRLQMLKNGIVSFGKRRKEVSPGPHPFNATIL